MCGRSTISKVFHRHQLTSLRRRRGGSGTITTLGFQWDRKGSLERGDTEDKGKGDVRLRLNWVTGPQAADDCGEPRLYDGADEACWAGQTGGPGLLSKKGSGPTSIPVTDECERLRSYSIACFLLRIQQTREM